MALSTRRTIALSGLLSVTVVPAALVACVAYYINRTEYPAEVAAEVSRQLGMQVELREVRYPYPGAVEYRGLALRDARATRLRAERVRIRRSAKRWHIDAHDVTVQLPGPQVRRRSGVAGVAGGPSGNDLSGLLRRFRPPGDGSVILSLADLTVETAQGTYHIERATTCYFVGRSGRPHLAGQFRVAEVAPAGPFSLELVLDDGGRPALEEFRLDTYAAALPVHLAKPVVPLTEWLGQDARLRGQLTAKRTPRGWDVQLRGRIAQVDLRRLAGRSLPFHLSGSSEWSIDAGHWREGQLVELRGQVWAGPGQVSSELLRALARDAGFLVSLEVPPSGKVPYGSMVFSFALERGSVRIAGRCDGKIDNLVIVGEKQEPLLRGPLGSTSMLGFARALSSPAPRRGILPAGYGEVWMNLLPVQPPGANVHAAP